MSTRVRLLFFALIALQVLSLLGFAAYRETVLRRGQEVTLQVIPVDPRDIFRGDFVVLRYEISRLDSRELCCPFGFQRGDSIYVRLEPSPSGEKWVAVEASHQREARWDTFIRGRVTQSQGSDINVSVDVEYGVESYFVPEGQGHEIESAISGRKARSLVAVDGRGTAVLKGILIDGELWQPE